MINAAVMGFGYWGPNIVKNFNAHPEISVLKICDISNKRLNNARNLYPDIDTTKTLIVNINSFAPSSLDFFIYTFTKTTDWIKYHAIKQDILLKQSC